MSPVCGGTKSGCERRGGELGMFARHAQEQLATFNRLELHVKVWENRSFCTIITFHTWSYLIFSGAFWSANTARLNMADITRNIWSKPERANPEPNTHTQQTRQGKKDAITNATKVSATQLKNLYDCRNIRPSFTSQYQRAISALCDIMKRWFPVFKHIFWMFCFQLQETQTIILFKGALRDIYNIRLQEKLSVQN